MLSALHKLYPQRYLVAVAVTGLTLLARAGLQPLLGERGRFVLFTLAVTFSAMNGGFGPGLVATALSLMFGAWAIFEPHGFLAVTEPANLLTLGLFALVGLSISGLSGELHNIRARLEAALRAGDEQILELNREIAQRRQIETALRESDERFKAFMEHNPAMAFIKDADGRYLYANPMWERYRSSNWQGKTVGDLWPADEGERLRQTDRRVLDLNEKVEALESIRGPDGSLRQRMVVKFPLNDYAGRKYIGGLSLDVTERWRAEESLRLSEERFNAFMDRSPAIAFMKDAAGRYVYVNKTWEELYGLNWRGKTDAELWPSDHVAMFRESDRRAVEAGHATEAFETVPDKDGRPQDWWVLKFPIVVADGERLLAGMAMDITEQKRTQEMLTVAHTALSLAMPGIARLDSQGRYLEVNEMYAGILGYEPAELVGAEWSVTVDAEDQPRVLASYERMLEVGQGECECRGVRKDGSKFFKQVLMVKIADGAGQHLGHHCFMRDISERKAAEQALLDSELKLRRIAAAMPGAVYQFVLHPDGRQGFLSVSDGIYDLIGHSAAAVVGDFSLLWDAVLAEDKDALADSILRSAQTMTPWMFEGRVRSADRPVKWIRGHSIPEPRRADGSIVWNGLLTDVTERKRDELEVRRLAAIVENSGDAIVGRDLDFKIHTWNGAAERLFGYSADEVIGKSIELLIPADKRAEVAHRRSQLSQGVETAPYDTVRLGRDDKRIDVSVTQSPIRDATGQMVGVSLSVRDITERKKTEAALRESEARYLRATAAGKVGVWELNYQTGIDVADDNLKAMFGYGPDELAADPFSWLALIHPDDRQKAVAASDAVLSGAVDHYLCELRMLCKDGSTKWTDVRGDVERDAEGRACRLSGTTVDVTARSLAEQAMRASEQSIRRLYEISNADAIPFETRLRDLLRHACERLGVANGALTRLSKDSVELSFVHSPSGELVEGAQVPLCNAYCKVAFETAEPICSEDAGESEFRDHPGYQALGFESYIGTRIMVKSKVYGALCFVAKQPRSGSLNQADRDFLKLLSAWVGSELARRQAEDYLQKSHDQIRQIIDTDPNFIFVKDRDGRYQLANQALAEAYGTTVDNLVGKTDADFNPNSAEVEFYRQKDLEVMDTLSERFIAEETITDSSGKVRWLQTTKRPILDGTGRVVQVLGAATDITARKLAEQALRESEQHLIAAQSIAHVGSWEWGFQSGRNSWSDENYRLLGYEPGSVEPNYDNWLQRIHPDDRWRVQEHLKLAFDGNNHCEIEYRVIHANGEVRSLHWRGEMFRDSKGNELRMAGTALDITDRKRAEAALRQAHDDLERRVEERTAELQRVVASLSRTEALLQKAIDVADLGIFERDHVSGEVYYSPTLKRILDMPDDRQAVLGDYLSKTHPGDREIVDAARQRTRHPAGHGHYSLEHRILRRDGSIGWVLNRGQTFFAGTGDARGPVRTVGAVLDITERKRSEEALRKNQEWLNQAVDVANLGIFEHDFVTDQLSYSPTLRCMLDWPEDLPPSTAAFLHRVYPDDHAKVSAAIAAAHAVLDGHLALEFRVVRRDGSIGWLMVRALYFYDGSGPTRRLLRSVGAALDITERMRSEEALRASEERLQHALAVGRMGTWERDLRSGRLTWDDRLIAIYGFAKDVVADLDLFHTHVHPNDLATLNELSRRAMQGGTDYDCEFRFLQPDGRMVWMLAHAGFRHDADGVPRYETGVVFDITERKEAEEALRKLNHELDQRVARRTQELAESQAGLRALVAELTQAEERERRRLAVELHDTLAQSLALVNMYVWRVKELLAEPVPSASIGDVLGHLDRTVDDSIRYTRTLIAQLSPPVLYDLGLPAAFRWLGQQMRKHDLPVEVSGPQEGVSLPQDDAVLIFQCVRELLWNVVKHAKASKARLSYAVEDGSFSVVVSDDGRGFAATVLEENSGGDGHFGLFSIRERIGYRGGQCLLGSDPARGARVELRLPVGAMEERKAERRGHAQARPFRDGELIRIAIVDDHKMLRQGLRRTLEEHGSFTVVGEAADGAEAVAVARALLPQVVIMDVNLPVMSGIDATQEILQEHPSTIVIGMSFGTDDYVVRAMQAAGAITCIPKERAVEDISEAIMDALAGRQVEKLIMEN